MTKYLYWKPFFDWVLAFFLILILFPILALVLLITSCDTISFGVFRQKRVGQYGRYFTIYKFKTMAPTSQKISPVGKFLRKTKLDELPQLFNIIKGEMSFVGPRPDIPGYYDKLEGSDRRVLQLKPGLTSEASLKYRYEEALLAQQAKPLEYNDKVLFPDKVQMNLVYLEKVSFATDCKIIWKTFFEVIR